MKTYKTFEDWARVQTPTQKRIISKLRKLVSGVAPKLEEASKWGNGVWTLNELPILFIYTAKDHLQFGFFAGSLLKDPKKILIGNGKFVRHLRVESLDDIHESNFSSLIKKAVKAPPYK